MEVAVGVSKQKNPVLVVKDDPGNANQKLVIHPPHEKQLPVGGQPQKFPDF